MNYSLYMVVCLYPIKFNIINPIKIHHGSIIDKYVQIIIATEIFILYLGNVL